MLVAVPPVGMPPDSAKLVPLTTVVAPLNEFKKLIWVLLAPVTLVEATESLPSRKASVKKTRRLHRNN